MVKKAILLFSAAACLAGGVVKAQQVHHCFTDEVHARMKKENPAAVAAAEAQLRAELDAALGKMNFPKLKVTAGDDDTAWKDKKVLHVPLVFHVVHDYGNQEYLSDDRIYEIVEEINEVYRGANPDTADVIATYKGNIPGTSIKYITNTNIQFHLAKRDPNGNPTNGITRRRNFVTTAGGDHAKFDIWPRQSYLNIWVVRAFDGNHAGAAAYAIKPSAANGNPYTDGPITFSLQPVNYDNTLAHEIGHSLNLDHPWGGTNSPEVACGDDDVDDTPPTDGHDSDLGCNDLEDIYDTNCILTSAGIGKVNINPRKKTTDALTGAASGIRFRNVEKVYIDQVHIYPEDSGANFSIALRHITPPNTVKTVGTYNGVTANNKEAKTIGLNTSNLVTTNKDTIDGVGITFRVFDSVLIRNVKFFTDSLTIGSPYTIVLKSNGVVVNTHTGVVTDSVMIAQLNFPVVSDSTVTYSLEFADNPGTKRANGATTSANGNIPNVMYFLSDNTAGVYNYFYNWNVYTFNYKQAVPVRFVAPVDSVGGAYYSLEFVSNPGAHRDSGYAAGANNIPNIMTFMLDTATYGDVTNGFYNYFYNWSVRYGDYAVTYSAGVAKNLFNINGPVTIDYPDTVNAQNVMDYTYCSKMFTYLQGVRMRAALRSTVAGRNNLIDTANLILTGVMNPDGTIASKLDLPPVADFAMGTGLGVNANQGYIFTCAGALGTNVRFANKSWNDTVTSIQWTFSNNATTPTATGLGQVNNKFNTPGWVTVEMVAASNAGADTLVSSDRVYAASDVATDPNGYFMEFNPGSNVDQYPTFNHFKNFTQWEVVNNAGFYDNFSIRYKQFDPRDNWPGIILGTPRGDYDDFYTPAFDLSGFSGNSYLTFFSAGAFRTNNVTWMNDTLEIAYSSNCGSTWTILKSLSKTEIGNNGVVMHDWTPDGFWNWQPQSITIPSNITNKERVFFRFRYKPGVEPNFLIGTGNNFYLDRIHVGKWSLDVAGLDNKPSGIALAPNPTKGNTFVLIKDANSKSAQIVVTDVTGKTVYTTQATLNNGINRVEIPAQYIRTAGMYMVSVTTGTQKQTEKLVVY